MASSIYQPWAVTAGEQPTTAYWNILGSNDASFNTGQGFNDGIIIPRHLGSGWALIDYSSTSTITGWSAFTAKVIKYQVFGTLVFVWFALDGTSNSTTATFTLPFVVNPLVNGIGLEASTGLAMNNGAVQSSPARVYVDASVNASLITIVPLAGTSNFTASGTKITRGQFWYEKA